MRCLFRQLCMIFLKLTVIRCDSSLTKKQDEGFGIAREIVRNFKNMFFECTVTSMPQQNFFVDNVQVFINSPSKTTVGVGEKFTTNRKFFANMISTTAFKTMLDHDVKELKKDIVSKLKFCDDAIMNPDLLKDFYVRESEYF
ncbi:uncharacterized protein LOC123690548 [Pieris rapae]|uniref:uncharacterized protein LOC123690548 n=1 Tax=Pieris rapae TaxID=64459 RepID=UPI001E27D763|nr:uncharacterized protein LOC123690548 [Pieris rapae]